MADLSDLEQHIKSVHKAREPPRGDGRKVKRRERCLGNLKRNMGRSSWSLRETTDGKPDCVLMGFWVASKPEEQFTADIHDRTMEVKMIKSVLQDEGGFPPAKDHTRGGDGFPARVSPNSQTP